jgi:hypothetical protein
VPCKTYAALCGQVRTQTAEYAPLNYTLDLKDAIFRVREDCLSDKFRRRGTDGTFSDIYLNYLLGQILIGGSRKRGISRLSPSPRRACVGGQDTLHTSAGLRYLRSHFRPTTVKAIAAAATIWAVMGLAAKAGLMRMMSFARSPRTNVSTISNSVARNIESFQA